MDILAELPHTGIAYCIEIVVNASGIGFFHVVDTGVGVVARRENNIPEREIITGQFMGRERTQGFMSVLIELRIIPALEIVVSNDNTPVVETEV